MKNLFALSVLLFTTFLTQAAFAENHEALEEPIIIPVDEPVIIMDAPDVVPLLEPAPNVSITINTRGSGETQFGMTEYDRGFNDGYDTAFGLQANTPSDDTTVFTGADGTEVSVGTDTDAVNVDVTVNDDADATSSAPQEEPVVVFDTDASNDAALGISPEFRAALNAHTLAVLDWQLKTSERVLLLIMFMSTAGIVFAGYQLWRSFDGLGKRVPAAEGETPAPQPAQANSTVSFDKGKFEVSSPVVGILVLVISLAALYMFLNFVYQIDVVPVSGTATATEAFE